MANHEETTNTKDSEPADHGFGATEMIRLYLKQHLDIYRELADLKKQVGAYVMGSCLPCSLLQCFT